MQKLQDCHDISKPEGGTDQPTSFGMAPTKAAHSCLLPFLQVFEVSVRPTVMFCISISHSTVEEVSRNFHTSLIILFPEYRRGSISAHFPFRSHPALFFGVSIYPSFYTDAEDMSKRALEELRNLICPVEGMLAGSMGSPS